MYSCFSTESRAVVRHEVVDRSICQVTCSLVILALRRRALARFNPCSSRGRHARVIGRQPRNSPHFLGPAGYSITVPRSAIRAASIHFAFFPFSTQPCFPLGEYKLSYFTGIVSSCTTGRDGRFRVKIE